MLGKNDIPNSSDSAVARTPNKSQISAETAPAGPCPSISMSSIASPSPNPSPPSTPLDVDAFSVISDLSETISIPEEPSVTDPCDQYDTHASTNPTDHLASIVERGLGLCEARRSLYEEILKDLEEREELYLDAVESAKSSLAMTRRKAIDLITRLKSVSGGIIGITLPWQHGIEKEAYRVEKKSPGPTPSPVTVSPATPVPVCPAPVPSQPVPAIVAPQSTLTPTPAPCSTTMVDQLPTASAPVQKPVFSSPLPVAPAPRPTTTSVPPTSSAPASKRSIPAEAPTVTSPHPNPYKHQAIPQHYEKTNNSARGTGNTASRYPQFPVDVADRSLRTTAWEANPRDRPSLILEPFLFRAMRRLSVQAHLTDNTFDPAIRYKERKTVRDVERPHSHSTRRTGHTRRPVARTDEYGDCYYFE